MDTCYTILHVFVVARAVISHDAYAYLVFVPPYVCTYVRMYVWLTCPIYVQTCRVCMCCVALFTCVSFSVSSMMHSVQRTVCHALCVCHVSSVNYGATCLVCHISSCHVMPFTPHRVMSPVLFCWITILDVALTIRERR